jgi:primary-amine oxidase
VAPNIEAPNHQHFFCFRLDLDVDGAAPNSVMEMDTQGLPEGPANPNLNAMAMTERPLRREQEAQRLLSLAASRKWKILNPTVRNTLGQPSGFLLLPGENSVPFVPPHAYLRRYAGFVNAHLWVTPYQPEEMYAAGDYVHRHNPGEGLPRWTSTDRPVENRDVVLWYTLGVTHIPRVEEWPVMPVHRAAFKLVPAGFFSRNPALDLPKSP